MLTQERIFVIKTFDEFYQEIYGSRWDALRSSLLKKERQVLRFSRWYLENLNINEKLKLNLVNDSIELNNCSWKENQIFEEIPRYDFENQNLFQFYIMDPASIVAPYVLEVKNDDRVLDMCAAPGGKSLVLIESAGETILNELSASRRERLKKVIQQYVPMAVRNHVWLKGQNAAEIGIKTQNEYDKILLDAPCSGERHLLENTAAMNEWSPRRTEKLAHQQYAMICSALLALKSGGGLVYSTCTLSPLENDGVIKKLLKKKSDQIQLDEVFLNREHKQSLLSLAEKTDYGFQFLPDRCGFGPFYLSKLIKN